MRTIETLLTAAMLLPQLSLAQPRNAEAKMSVLENDQIRFGANLTLGGAITLLSTKDGPNMINSHDWGRQIQMSFYSGPKPFEPNGKKPADHWKQLGWNPIQSGDFGGNTSTILEHRNDGKTIYVKCRPMHWPLNNQPAQCTFECIYKLDGNVVEVTSRLVNARDDKTQYGARSQELPALYSNGPWYKIMTYTGAKPYTGGELTELSHKPENPPFPWNHFQATEEWSALVDKENHGFGVWTPGLQSYLGGFSGKPGSGGPKSSPTGYLAPLHMEILDHNIVYTYKYRLVVGSLGDIRRYVYEQRAPQQGLNFVFKSDRQHWHFRNAADKGMPLKGVWEVQLEQNNPSIISPPFCLDAEMVKTVTIRAAFKTGEPKARLIWTKHGNKKPSPEDVISFPVKPDGITRTYTVQLAGNENWHGTITRLALRPCRKGAEGSRLTLESVRAQ